MTGVDYIAVTIMILEVTSTSISIIGGKVPYTIKWNMKYLFDSRGFCPLLYQITPILVPC